MDALLLVPVLILLALLFPSLELWLRLRGRAKNDYLHSRGTLHRNLLQTAITKLDSDITQLRGKVQALTQQRQTIADTRDKELERALTSHIMEQELENVPGIGPVLKERIIRSPYSINLDNLARAGPIKGLGNEKSTAIRRWARNMKAKVPKRLRDDFPGKTEITEKYAVLDSEAEKELSLSSLQLQDLEALRKDAANALAELRMVHASTFLDAYRGDREASEAVTHYLTGVFPEWRSPPQWFKKLTEKYM